MATNNTDYAALMNAAAAKGDYAAAAKYEQQRNAKIDAMNASGQNSNNYQKSYKYSNQQTAKPQSSQGAANNTDFAALMNAAAAKGDYTSAALYEQQRNAKVDAMNAAGQNPKNYQKTYKYSSPSAAQTSPSGGQQANPNAITAQQIKDLYAQMQAQSKAQIDYGVEQAAAELRRAQEEAQKGFEAQRNQNNIDEAQARDRQVLYAAARGDQGGITAREYDSISNTASNNRRAIAEQQQKLATDTARQIADLRAQGEFEKANAVLKIAQQQLAQLWELQQYEDNKAMQEANLTGFYNGQLTYAAQQNLKQWDRDQQQWDYEVKQNEKSWAYEVAMQSIQLGMLPSDDVLATAGLDKNTATQMAGVYKAAMAAKSSGSGSGSGSGSSGGSKSAKTTKPTLTYAQTMQAIDRGDITPNVLSAYKYYLGVDYQDPDAGGGNDPTIANQHGDSWVYVSGLGRLSYQELKNYVAKGKVIETVNKTNNTVSYRLKR